MEANGKIEAALCLLEGNLEALQGEVETIVFEMNNAIKGIRAAMEAGSGTPPASPKTLPGITEGQLMIGRRILAKGILRDGWMDHLIEPDLLNILAEIRDESKKGINPCGAPDE